MERYKRKLIRRDYTYQIHITIDYPVGKQEHEIKFIVLTMIFSEMICNLARMKKMTLYKALESTSITKARKLEKPLEHMNQLKEMA